MDRLIEDKRWIKKKYWKYIAGTAVLLVLLAFVLFHDYESTFKVEKEKLSVATVFEGPFQDYINVIGQVEPISIVSVEALEGGRIESIPVGEGTSMVEKGDVLIQLSNEEMNLNFMDEEAYFKYLTNDLNNQLIDLEQDYLTDQQELISQDYDLNEAQRLYEKNETLHEKGGVSDVEYQQSKNSYEFELATRQIKVENMKLDSVKRENNRKQIELEIQSIRQQIDNLKIKAPVDGQFSLGDIALGESILKGTKVGQISVLSSYKIKAQIDEHYIDRVQQGLTATLERQGEIFKLQIMKVYQEVVGGVFDVDMRFQGSLPQNIRTGQSYYIDLQLGETQNAVQLAKGGFFQSTGGQWVFILDPDGITASKRQIQIGRQNPQYYEVLSGLQPAEEVIISGYDLFGDNDKLILK